jgi:signal transduction histidine kinase
VQTVNLNALLSDFVPLIEQSMGEAIRVELVLDPTLKDCRADLGQLKAALFNLALNARDAMVNGGTLIVATKNASQWVAVSFRDTGIGMTEDVKTRIFEPFFTTKDVGEGSGLGLSQALGFVQQVGGHVAVDSKIGLGTTVTLYFPQLQHASLTQNGPVGYG